MINSKNEISSNWQEAEKGLQPLITTTHKLTGKYLYSNYSSNSLFDHCYS